MANGTFNSPLDLTSVYTVASLFNPYPANVENMVSS